MGIVTVAFSLSSNCTKGRPTRLERPITMAFMPSSEACTLLLRKMQPSGVQGDDAANPPRGVRHCSGAIRRRPWPVDGIDDGFGSSHLAAGLRRDPMHRGSRLSVRSAPERPLLRDVGRQHVLERRHAGFLGLLVLAADIDLAGRVAADQHPASPGFSRAPA